MIMKCVLQPAQISYENIVGSLVFGIAGLILFASFFGRILAPIKSGLRKRVIMHSVLLLIVVLPFLFGYRIGISAVTIFPFLILVAATFLDVRRLEARRKYRGSRPVESSKTSLSIFRPLTTYRLSKKRYEIKAPNLNAPLRIVHISDLHVKGTTVKSFLPQVLKIATAFNPDLLFITGDFTARKKHIPLLSSVLPLAKAKLGCFAVLGNHDFWDGEPEIDRALKDAGIKRLANSSHRIVRENGDRITISGYEAPWNETKGKDALPENEEPHFVLTHSPDNIFKIAQSGVTAVYAGHYHGGHFVIPYYGSLIIPSKHGRLFDQGHFKVNNTHLFVTTGLGASFPPVRIYCNPEILITDYRGRNRTGDQISEV